MASVTTDTPAAPGKRKRKTISHAHEDDSKDTQVSIDNEAHHIDDESIEDHGEPAPAKKVRKKSSKLPKDTTLKVQTISFNDLSAELRNKIYELALVDNTEDVRLFCVRSDFRRRRHKQVYMSGGTIRPRLGRRKADGKSKVVSSIAINLLAVSKQVYSESVGFLYGQPLSFGTPKALWQFLTTIGPRNRARIFDIKFLPRIDWRSCYGDAHLCDLKLLAQCLNLKRLDIGQQHICMSSASVSDAIASLWDMMGTFFGGFGIARGDKYASISLLNLKPKFAKSFRKSIDARL